MANEQELSDSASASLKSASTASETSPLLARRKTSKRSQARKWPKSVIYRVLVTSFMVSLSFGVTQVPLIYIFGVMECEDYYKHHKSPPIGTPAYDERCRTHSIEGNTARQVALLGSLTTIFGVANLFVTGWAIKAWGVKKALILSIFWPTIRLLVQNVGVMTGGRLGLIIIQSSQITTIIGGPSGYLLALNSFATEVVLPIERTATLGRLQGCAMFGTGAGFLAGGLIMDQFAEITPFRVALVLFGFATLYSSLILPTVSNSTEVENKATMSLKSFFEPLTMFTPRKWILQNGNISKEYGVLLLGIGASLAVFATGYIPVLLQMYATDVFGFSASDNSELIALNFCVRAAFLTFAFPAIIGAGRKIIDEREAKRNATATRNDEDSGKDEHSPPVEPAELASTALPPGEANVNEPDEPLERTTTSTSTRNEENECFEFDLIYARFSVLFDGILTSVATFTTSGWQLFGVAAIIPLAAGTGSASKGVMLQMCAPEQKVDALSAISLMEMAARLSTTSVFGLIFAAFAEIGRPSLTFAVNGAVAVFGFVVLMLARFPPEGAVRWRKADNHDDIGD